MIISASYKTDIPAFYGAWFMNRLRAGYCLTRQPYNRRTLRVSLLPEDVDGFVFWTRNIAPFMRYLPEIRNLGRPFIVQYTITGYPRELESAVVSSSKSVMQMHRLAGDFGGRAAVWRYDPILISSLTDADFHRRNFAALARHLAGATDEVIVSFAQFYRKTQLNLRRAAPRGEFTWNDPATEIKTNLLADLCGMAAERGMRLSLCAQPEYLIFTTKEARCIDVDRLSSIAGRSIIAEIRGNRPGCACHASRDIGEYDTCPHGCVYCYAVRSRADATGRYHQHDAGSEFLYSPA